MHARPGRHRQPAPTLGERLGAILMLIGIFGGPALADALTGR